MLILNSIKISTMWSQAYHLSLTELLDDYFNLSGFVGYFPYGYLLYNKLFDMFEVTN